MIASVVSFAHLSPGNVANRSPWQENRRQEESEFEVFKPPSSISAGPPWIGGSFFIKDWSPLSIQLPLSKFWLRCGDGPLLSLSDP